MKQLVNGSKAKAEGLVARERSQEKGYGNSDRGRLESKTRNKSCKYCKKKNGNCYKLWNKNRAAVNHKGKQSINFGQFSVAKDDHTNG